MGNKKKMTVLDFQKYKDEGRKFSFVTAYDYTTASIVNESDCEIILVGDSLGMIMLGYNTTVPVTVDDMIHHIRPVVKGAPDTFIIGDMPFGSYRSEEHTSELQSRETISYAVFCEAGGRREHGSHDPRDGGRRHQCDGPHRYDPADRNLLRRL